MKKHDLYNVAPMIKAMDQNDLVYFYLGSLISADNNLDEKMRKVNIRKLEDFLKYLPEVKLVQARAESYKQYAEKALNMLKEESEKLSEIQ